MHQFKWEWGSITTFNQFVASVVHPFRSKNVRSIVLDTCADCPDCGMPLKRKARASRSLRTLFGTCKFSSPRLDHCDCQGPKTSSFRPLAALLTESVAPELLSMEAKW